MSSSPLYAYLKPSKGDSPYYIHLTLDGKERSLRTYWHMSWWKNEHVHAPLFEQWKRDFQTILGLLQRGKVKEKKNSYRITGRCSISSRVFADIIGFVEPDTQAEIPVKLECYVNSENKIIEIEMHTPYAPLGSLPNELIKLSKIFTHNPDYETVRSKLVFFNPAHIVSFSPKGQGSEVFSKPDLPLPAHHGSPEAARRSEENEVPKLDLDNPPEDTIDTWNGHPYGQVSAEKALENPQTLDTPIKE